MPEGALFRALTQLYGAYLIYLSEGTDRRMALVLGKQAVNLLEEPASQQAIHCELHQLSSGRQEPLLSLEQLRYAVWCLVSFAASDFDAAVQDAGGSSASSSQRQLAAAANTLSAGAHALTRLEPTNLKSLYLAAQASTTPSAAAAQRPDQLVSGWLRCFQDAQRQRSGYYTAMAGIFALNAACFCQLRGGSPVKSRTMQAAAHAFQEGCAAMRRCRDLLPLSWQAGQHVLVAHVQRIYSQVRQRPQSHQPASTREVAAARDQLLSALQEGLASDPALCSSCGKQSVGLRRCAGCRKAQYCR